MKTLLLITMVVFQCNLIYSQNNTSLKPTKKSTDSLRIRPSTLNILFAEELNGIAFQSEDLTLQRYYATLTNEDNKFSFGITLNNLRKKSEKLNWIYAIGIASKSKSGFATIFKDNEIQNEFNGTIKISKIGRGVITRNSIHKTSLSDYYSGYLKDKYTKLNDSYEGNPSKLIDNELKRLVALGQDTTKSRATLIKLSKVKNELSLSIDEMNAIRNNGWYTRIWDHWGSIEAKLPFSIKEYMVSDSLTNPTSASEKQYPWKFSGQYTSMWKWSNELRIYTTLKGQVYHNNNIETEDLSSADFLSFINQSATNSAVTETSKVYIGDFKRFVTTSLGGELIIFPWNSWIGISASAEQTLGNFQTLNWKLGIPVTLKDKEGKPKVNFELQWKEVNKSHLVGIRVGFILGKFIG